MTTNLHQEIQLGESRTLEFKKELLQNPQNG